MLIDTHAHLTNSAFEGDLEGILARAEEAGISKIITVGINLEDSEAAVALAEQYPQIYAAVGIHPHYADSLPHDYREQLSTLARHEKVVAIGETGLDLFRANPEEHEKELSAQIPLFRAQLGLAVQLDLPVIIHTRETNTYVLKEIERYQLTQKLRGVVHCFSGDTNLMKEVLEKGFIISFTGIITYNKAEEVQEVVATVPDHSYMVETDCPYLAPTPYRGKQNEPQYVSIIAQKIAELRGLPLKQIEKETTKTAHALFTLP